MYKWIIRISTAVVGAVLLVMVRLLEWYPIFYAVPLTIYVYKRQYIRKVILNQGIFKFRFIKFYF